MTPEEQVARVLAQPVRLVVPGVGGLSGFLMDPESLAAEVVKALGLREEQAIINAFKPGDRWHLRKGGLHSRLVTDWREVES